ncbi:hypothetical protein OESDEN_02916 [Oesophagostomum dentatum]|uniref:Uncharacterized protein n=1 Tax=Oesophagostomum dentatum TaxID=61180 RepID=A0A0B1TIP8_OESDE|nr:hypothetical protein OESDEN_02916 [Oesophagostomum dentatum]
MLAASFILALAALTSAAPPRLGGGLYRIQNPEDVEKQFYAPLVGKRQKSHLPGQQSPVIVLGPGGYGNSGQMFPQVTGGYGNSGQHLPQGLGGYGNYMQSLLQLLGGYGNYGQNLPQGSSVVPSGSGPYWPLSPQTSSILDAIYPKGQERPDAVIITNPFVMLITRPYVQVSLPISTSITNNGGEVSSLGQSQGFPSGQPQGPSSSQAQGPTLDQPQGFPSSQSQGSPLGKPQGTFVHKIPKSRSSQPHPNEPTHSQPEQLPATYRPKIDSSWISM